MTRYACAPGSAIAHLVQDWMAFARAPRVVCGVRMAPDWQSFRTKPRTRRKCSRCAKCEREGNL